MTDFEDFKLEPLSDGLGFHKKKVNLDSEVKRAGFVDEKLTLNMPVTTPLPIQPKKTNLGSEDDSVRISNKARGTTTVAPFKDRSFKLSAANTLNNKVKESKAPDKVVVKFREVESKHSFVSLVFDFFVVSGLFLTASFMLFVVTNLDMDVLLSGLVNDPLTQGMMAILFFSISIFYLVLSRSVTFCTLGEWALDIKLGTEKHRSSIFYPIRVFLRSFIILITGVLPITLLSLIRKKDCLRKILPLVKNVPIKP